MKYNPSESASSSMSNKGYSLKLRVLILVVNTANLINERATPTLGISNALTAPSALFTTYIFIGIFVLGAIHQHYASWLLQVYALLACCSIQTYLSFIIFKELKVNAIGKQHATLVLNGVLPMINAILLLIDLMGIIFSTREEVLPPSSLPTNATSSQTDM